MGFRTRHYHRGEDSTVTTRDGNTGVGALGRATTTGGRTAPLPPGTGNTGVGLRGSGGREQELGDINLINFLYLFHDISHILI